MRKIVSENLSKFFYDCGKVSFTVFIIGTLAKKPVALWDLVLGIISTLTLVIFAIMISAQTDRGGEVN